MADRIRIPNLSNLTNPIIEEWSPEGRAVCYIINKPVEAGGFDRFEKAATRMMERYGELRVLIYYHAYQGYEAEAAKLDLGASATHGPDMRKLAMINAPEKIMFNIKLRALPSSPCETRFFAQSELQQAVEWINT